MALTKRTYVDGETVIIAQNLNDIQDEIIANGTAIGGKTSETAVAPVEASTTATNAYSVDNLFFLGNTLYEATAAIAIGGTIAVGTNCQVATVADEVSQLKAAINDLDEAKADIDGSYESLTAGNAMQLDSYTYAEDKEPYLFRQTGGSVEAGNREEDCIVGATIAWNQLVKNGNFASETGWSGDSASYTVSNNVMTFVPSNNNGKVFQQISGITAGHIYLVKAELKATDSSSVPALFVYFNSSGNMKTLTTGVTSFQTALLLINVTNLFSVPQIQVRNSNANNVSDATIQAKNVVCTDLTAMFGSTIADRAYALEQAAAGSGIAWLKSMGFFTEPYYAYDAGSLQSVKVGSHKLSGTNLIPNGTDLSNGYAPNNYLRNDGIGASATWAYISEYFRVVPNETYVFSCTTDNSNPAICFYDANKQFISGVKQNTLLSQVITSPPNAFYARSTQGYESGVIHFQLSCGSTSSSYVPYREPYIYPLDTTKEWRGILKLDANNKVYADGDIYPPSGEAQRRYGIVDLGTLYWGKDTYFVADLPNDSYDLYGWNSYLEGTTKCALYSPKNPNVGWNSIENMQYGIAGKQLRINNQSYSDTAAFKTAMSGVYLVYELATPTSESALPYTTPQICDASGTEEYTDYAVAVGTRDVAVPVGHQTKYPPDQIRKLDGLPWDLSMIAPIENGTTASQAYAQGKYFMRNNQFCKAKTSIASGATFTLGTNYEVTTVADELFSALNS